MDPDELKLSRIFREFEYYERKGGTPYFTAVKNPKLSLRLYRLKIGKYKSLAFVEGKNPKIGIHENKKRAVQISLESIVQQIKYTQGGAYIMTSSKLADAVVDKCPSHLRFDIVMPHAVNFKLSAPTPPSRIPSVSLSQSQFTNLLPENIQKIISTYSYTYDCDNFPHRDERLMDGVLVNGLKTTTATVTLGEIMMLCQFYIDNKAPRNKEGKLLNKIARKPTDEQLFKVRMKNGACAPLMFWDDGANSKKYTKMASLIMSTQEMIKRGRNAPIACSRVFSKAEVEVHTKGNTYKKIRAIQNAAPETVMLFSYLFDTYMQITSGVLFGDMMGVSTAHSPIQEIMMYWYATLMDIWQRKGITTFEGFLNEVDRRGADISDQKAWESTTEEKTAIYLIFILVSSLEPESYKRERDWIDPLLANLMRPHAVLKQKGNKAVVISKLGATESGSKPTLWGNTKRHGCMSDLFYIKAYKNYERGEYKLDNVELPKIQDWKDELKIFYVCENIMGDDRMALRTAFSEIFHVWKDHKFGTITVSRLTKNFFCTFDDTGMPDDSAEYLQFSFTRRTPNVLRCERPLGRIAAKLIHKPFEQPEHALASCQMAMYNVCQEGYVYLKKFYDLMIENLVEDTEKMKKKLIDYWKNDEEFKLYESPSLAPPPPIITDAYKLDLKTGDLFSRINAFKKNKNDPKNYMKLKF
jgi:hypothetical protein